MYMKKFLIFIITSLLVACGDSDPRQKDKDKVTELLLKKDDWKTMGFTYRETECLVNDVSSNMKDNVWEIYVESLKLESIGLSENEILERLNITENLTETELLQFVSALVNAIYSFECVSEERLIEAEGNL